MNKTRALSLITKVSWVNIHPGQVVLILKGDVVPAGVVMLCSSDGSCKFDASPVIGNDKLSPKEPVARMQERIMSSAFSRAEESGCSVLDAVCGVIHDMTTSPNSMTLMHGPPNPHLFEFAGK